jgi:alkylation response protein AidB-like acyl-CoA dehydrogenase
VLPTIQAALLVQRCGSDGQRERLLPGLTAVGENAARVLLLESNGRGTAEWGTTALRDRDNWTINGRKVAVNDNGGKLCVIVAAADGGAAQIFAVAANPPGLSLRNAEAQPTMALGASRIGTVDLNGVVLTEEDRLSSDGADTLQAVALSRLLLGAISLGCATASLDYARDWVVNRTAFGKKLAAFEGVAFDVADVDTKLQAAQFTLRQVAYDVQSMDDAEAIDDLVARTLARVTAVCASAATDGVQLMGVHGIIHDHPQELFHRTASALSVLDADPLRAGFQIL